MTRRILIRQLTPAQMKLYRALCFDGPMTIKSLKCKATTIHALIKAKLVYQGGARLYVTSRGSYGRILSGNRVAI